ncbi:MAG TPA: virulence protein RhuM/Fic/DOC family protein [Rickettsia endosymbiont of Pyrocoelia pectoralis]|nr:virulence protein RhuM/Fic/DOC family protein [Rickettsia endosymbiont of Pyrocoelia pectoralis]
MSKEIESQIVIYQDENGEVNVDVKVADETVWLSLNQIAELFARDKSVISRHLKNIFKESELEEKATVAFFATVQIEGEKSVERKIEYYNLDVIISVGYRVNSKRGIAFRKWATNLLKEYLIKGYSINQDKITEKKLNNLQQTIELLTNTLINQNLVNNTGQELINLIRNYSKTWEILVKYDEDKLNPPIKLQSETNKLLEYPESLEAIKKLKQELSIEQDSEISDLFGSERDNSFKGILGNIDQTFDGKSLYNSAEEKAAHLLYFIIKDHPFSDGNKRIGCLLFLLYLTKAKVELKNIGVSAMTSLALLIAESDPIQKELMINLIMNLISD